MAVEQQPQGVEQVEGSIKKMEGFLPEDRKLADDLGAVSRRLTEALKDFREKNPDAANKITEAVFAKVEEIRTNFLQQIGGGTEKAVADTREKLIALGTILKQTPPPIEKPGWGEKAWAAIATTAREKNIDVLVGSINDIRVEIETSPPTKAAEAEGVHVVSTGISAPDKAPKANDGSSGRHLAILDKREIYANIRPE
jgi:hypothetical protein